MQILMYCEEAARAGVPVETVEIVNDIGEPRLRIVGSIEDVDWSELYVDLKNGFVYDGVLHSRLPDRDGREWDSFASGNSDN